MNDTSDARQPAYGVPLKLSLTPQEIMGLAVNCHTGVASFESLLADAEVHREYRNRRTQFACRLASGEFAAEDPNSNDMEKQYMVEMEVEGAFIQVRWICDANDDAMIDRLRKCAEQTLIAWTAVIGVQVGYGLTVNPYGY